MNILKTIQGKIELGKDNSSLVHQIGSGDATNAKFSGNDIVVLTYKGKTELRKENGSLFYLFDLQ